MAVPEVALITAGSAGLGAATARLFASVGMRVVINYWSNTERADALVEDLKRLSPLGNTETTVNFLAIKADLAKRADVIRLVEESVEKLGTLDVVFSNGGWTRIRDFMDFDDNMDEEDWDRCFAMNVKSHAWLMHAARPWLEASEGAFITTASYAGVRPGGSSLPYSVTKAAQIHLMKGLALNTSPKIRVNSVSPGLLLTEWGMLFSQEVRDRALTNTKLGKLPTVEDVAAQVLCYARSKTVTGQNAVIVAGTDL